MTGTINGQTLSITQAQVDNNINNTKQFTMS